MGSCFRRNDTDVIASEAKQSMLAPITPRNRHGRALQPHRGSSSLPHLWGGWPAERPVGWGPIGTAHRHIAPTPASASLRPTLPTKGGGTRKSDLSPQAKNCVSAISSLPILRDAHDVRSSRWGHDR